MNTTQANATVYFTFRGARDSQDVYVCATHAKEMPAEDGETVTSGLCDDGIPCEFCPDYNTNQ
jgi:hypothetical protein